MSVTTPVPVASRPSTNGHAPTGLRIGAGQARRLPWVALAAVLVVGGGLLVGLLVAEAGDRDPVLFVARPLSPGQVIEAADLGVVEVGVEGDATLVPASSRAALVGQVARAALPQGALLSPGQVGPPGDLDADSRVVGALLGPGELPVANLRPGDRVELVAVAGEGEDSTTLGQARVFDATAMSQGGQFVSLVTNAGLAPAVAEAASQRRLRLVLVPVGG